VVWLHRSNNLLLAKTRDVRQAQVLRMFDAEAAIAGAIESRDLSIKVEDLKVGFIADSVDHDLESRPIPGLDALTHDALRHHLVKEQAPISGLVLVGLKE
jgi:hypothetical protein